MHPINTIAGTVLAVLMASGGAMAGETEMSSASADVIVDFADLEEARAWRIVNDNVMGGRSIGDAGLTGDHMVFTGSTNTNGGGFASVRRAMGADTLAGHDTFVLEVKQDGRGYQLTARTSERFRGRLVSYQAPIPKSAEGEWTTVRIPMNAMTPSVFGRSVPAPDYDAADTNQIGIIINDGLDGPFLLEVRTIAVE
jgi:hypothetical protein